MFSRRADEHGAPRRSYFLATIFGAATGVSEIITRYRDEPLLATVNRYGLSYAATNGALSAAAFALLSRYSTQLPPFW